MNIGEYLTLHLDTH